MVITFHTSLEQNLTIGSHDGGKEGLFTKGASRKDVPGQGGEGVSQKGTKGDRGRGGV